MRNSNRFGLIVSAILFVTVMMTSCSYGDGGLPNGHYVPVDSNMTMLWVQEIIIKGDRFKVVYPFEGLGVTLKYKYSGDTLSLSKDIVTVKKVCEFKNDTLRFAGISFIKTN